MAEEQKPKNGLLAVTAVSAVVLIALGIMAPPVAFGGAIVGVAILLLLWLIR